MLDQVILDLPGAVRLAGFFILLIAIAEGWTRVFHPGPELSRKIVHTGGGFLCLLFPFHVQSPWTVLLLAMSMTALFHLGSKFKFLLCLCRVDRRSRGSEYYPLAIFFVFLFSSGKIWIYVASILVLACADAGAALVGSRYGSIRYTVDRETKSLEGSLVFLFLAFVCVLLPLCTMSPLALDVSILTSLLIAIVVTVIEAVSRNGRDNLFVPIAVCLVLPKITAKPIDEIVYQNISLMGVLGLLSLAVWKSKSMNVGGCLTAILFVYACWSLGAELWVVPLIGAFALFLLSWRSAKRSTTENHSIRVPAVVRALTAPFLILLFANVSGEYDSSFAPFVATIMQITSSFLLAHSANPQADRNKNFHKNIFLFALATWFFVALPSWYFQYSADTALLFTMLILMLPSAYACFPLLIQGFQAAPFDRAQNASSITWFAKNQSDAENVDSDSTQSVASQNSRPFRPGIQFCRNAAAVGYGRIGMLSIPLIVYGLELLGLPTWIHWQLH